MTSLCSRRPSTRRRLPPICRSATGSITPITQWIQYADPRLAPTCRSQTGSYTAVGDIRVPRSGSEAEAESKDRSALMDAMDKLNLRFGRDAVRIGSATAAKANDVGSATWAVKQDRRRPRYTTRCDEMPVVR